MDPDPDWSLLPVEMLQLISEKITSMDQYVHFRSVCRPWKEASTRHPRHLIPPIPWLGILHQEDPSFSTLSLYDFSKSRTHDIELPAVNWKEVCGHSHGWIVLEKGKELSLIKPITRDVKTGCFPSLSDRPIVLGFARNEKTMNPRPSDEVDRSIIRKAILTSSPLDMDCIVVAEFRTEWELGFSRINDSCWTILKLREYGHPSQDISDFMCINNLVYVVTNKGCLTIYDLRDLSQRVIIDNLSYVTGLRQLRLVGELDGVPLLVKHNSGSSLVEAFKCMGCEWRRVTNIGNSVVLENYKTSEILSLGNIRLDGWEGNHVCSYARMCSEEKHGSVNIKIEMTSVENGRVKEVRTSLGLFSRGSIGGIFWFTPSLC